MVAPQPPITHSCALTAFTGKAAFAIGGVTIHSVVKLPVKTKYRPLKGGTKARLEAKLKTLKWIVIDDANANTRGQHSLSAMEGGNGLSPPTPHRNRFMPTAHSRVLMELYDADSNGIGCLGNGPKHRTLDAIDDGGGDHIVWIVLQGVEPFDGRNFLGCHRTMQAQPNHHRPWPVQAAAQCSQR